MNIDFYCDESLEFLNEFCEASSLQRLKNIGMNCGCEYTNFPCFRDIYYYSRYDHSLGAAKIVWHFTHDKTQTLATLFHDIASPAFAHTIDFLNGDYLLQESTEDLTQDFIKSDVKIVELLNKYEINIDDVTDYHLYPYCDNHIPALSTDRLEYTIGNIVNFKYADLNTVKEIYKNIEAGYINSQTPELIFSDIYKASEFANLALQCCKIYASDEDRYSMQILSEIIALALKQGVLTKADLYTTETEVIAKLVSSPITKNKWLDFRQMSKIVKDDDAPLSLRRMVRVKKRYIDPFIKGMGRLSEHDTQFRNDLNDFLQSSQDYWICGQ